MKNISSSFFKSLAALALLFNVSACQQMDIDTQPGAGIKLSTDVMSNYTRPAVAAEPIIFNVSSTTPWKISQSADTQWCKVSPAVSSVAGLTAEIVVELEDNPDLTDRDVILTLSAEGVEAKHTITIVQTKKTNFTYQPLDDLIPATGGNEFTFTVTSNKDWTVRSEKQWLTFDKSSGTGSDQMQTIKVTIGANSGAQRDCKVFISNGTEEISFTVVQKGFTLEFAGVTDNKDEFVPEGAKKRYTINANVAWKATCEDPTVKLERISDTELDVTIGGNNIFGTKKTLVVLKPESAELAGVVDCTIEISQLMNFSYSGDVANVTYNTDGSVTLIPSGDSKNSRMATNNVYGLGTFIWKFSNVHFENKGYFDINAYPLVGNASYRYYIGTGGGNKLTSGGSVISEITGLGIDFWAGAYNFTLDNTQLNAMRELKLVVEPLSSNPDKLKMELFINGASIGKNEARVNIWKHLPSHGVQFNFGFINAIPKDNNTITIKSFDAIPYKN